MLTLVLILGAVVAVVLIALVTVGREVFTLSRQPRQAVFDLDEAVDQVADRLPFEVSAKLSYDDVRTLLGWHLDYLQERGVPDEAAAGAIGAPVVVADDDALAHLLAKADESGLDMDDGDVAAVFEAETAYFRAIGAIGPEVAGPDDPG